MLASETVPASESVVNDLEYRLSERPLSIDQLLERRRKPLTGGNLLDFGSPHDFDQYNCSAPIKYDDGGQIVVVREEEGDQFSSQIQFFRQGSGYKFHRETGISNLSELSSAWICQDPATAYVQGSWVITQVEVDPASISSGSGSNYHSAIYAGERLDSLELIARSPVLMKGVRLVELLDHKIGVFTRPQSSGNPQLGGSGKIGFTIVESLQQINTDVLAQAPLIPDLYTDDDTEWEGDNDNFLLPNGEIAVLGHKARFEPSEIDRSRGYYPFFFILNPETLQVSHQQILAKLADYQLNEEIKAKQPELENVYYPSALLFERGDITASYAELWGGAKDSKMLGFHIPNPIDSWLMAHAEYDSQPFNRPVLRQDATAVRIAA